jgi:hypothetical protein
MFRGYGIASSSRARRAIQPGLRALPWRMGRAVHLEACAFAGGGAKGIAAAKQYSIQGLNREDGARRRVVARLVGIDCGVVSG